MPRRHHAGFAAAAALSLLLAVAAASNGPLEAAQGLFEEGKYSEALRTLEAALKDAPQDARLHYWVARCHFELRNVDAAVLAAERAVELDAENSDYHLWLGHATGKKADRDRSPGLARRTKKAFQEAVRLNPASLPARRALVDYLSDAPWIVGGSDRDARKQIEAIAALDAVEAHLAWADYWKNNDEPERAEPELRRVLELKHARIEPYLEAARFYEKQGEAAQIEVAVDAASTVNSQDRRLGYYRAVAWTLAGKRLPEAEGLLDDYLKTPERSGSPSHAGTHEWLGRVCERMGRTREAIEHYRQALAKDPNRKYAREALKRLGK